MNRRRMISYLLSAVAVVTFFFLPMREIGVVVALVLQTVAFISIAGRSPLDGFLLCGISFVLIGVIPADHPLVTGADTFHDVRATLIGIGVVIIGGSLTGLLVRKHRRGH